jgi:hypothetical protein
LPASAYNKDASPEFQVDTPGVFSWREQKLDFAARPSPEIGWQGKFQEETAPGFPALDRTLRSMQGNMRRTDWLVTMPGKTGRNCGDT